MTKNHQFLVGIFGGIGSGKKILCQKLAQQLPCPKFYITPVQKSTKFQNFEYRIFIDKPYDELLEKYVLNLHPDDHRKLEKNLADFRKFHMENVVPQRFLADFYFQGTFENEEKLHNLTMEILKKYRKIDCLEEDEAVQIHMEANHGKVQKSHPNRLKSWNSEIF